MIVAPGKACPASSFTIPCTTILTTCSCWRSDTSQLSSTDVNRGKEYVSKTLKVAGTIATATSTALTIYNNYGKIKEIVNGMAKKAG